MFAEPGGYSFQEPEKWKRFVRHERLIYVVGDGMKRWLLLKAGEHKAREVYAVGLSEFRERIGQATLTNYEGRTAILAEALGPA